MKHLNAIAFFITNYFDVRFVKGEKKGRKVNANIRQSIALMYIEHYN